jgi:photosystem II stability/assembly factor-like uncharacterized protein
MKIRTFAFARSGMVAALVSVAALATPAWAQNTPALTPVPAVVSAQSAKAAVLGSALAGRRVVTVGDHGVVRLSDDQGRTWRQARSVPLDATLTSVHFADAKQGWAVGHWGAILHTADGGETWQLQRLKTDEDRPLFAVHFFDARHGLAVGLWSLVLRTEDGGHTWQESPPAAPPGGGKADHNLWSLFADGQGQVYATAERGQVLASADQGRSWRHLDTGYKGSLWAGVVQADGTLLVAGLRGHVLRSADRGQTWQDLPSGTTSSFTSVVAQGHRLTLVGMDGVSLSSDDGGAHWSPHKRPDALALTSALALPDGRTLLFSAQGAVR